MLHDVFCVSIFGLLAFPGKITRLWIASALSLCKAAVVLHSAQFSTVKHCFHGSAFGCGFSVHFG